MIELTWGTGIALYFIIGLVFLPASNIFTVRNNSKLAGNRLIRIAARIGVIVFWFPLLILAILYGLYEIGKWFLS